MAPPLKAIAKVSPMPPAKLFADADTIERIIDQVAAEARAHVPDVTTAKGREAIASVAYSVARSKTFIDDAGKTLTAEHRAIVDRVNASRRMARERLDALKAEIRAPLDEWENAEAERQRKINQRVAWLETAGRVDFGATAADIQQRLNQVEAFDCSELQEHADRGESLKIIAAASLGALHQQAVAAEKQAAELAELREKERERAEAERRAAQERAAQAEAERQAQADRDRAAAAAQAEAEGKRAPRETWPVGADSLGAAESTPAERLARKVENPFAKHAPAPDDVEVDPVVERLARAARIDLPAAARVVDAIADGRVPGLQVAP